jgi:plastocyanin
LTPLRILAPFFMLCMASIASAGTSPPVGAHVRFVDSRGKEQHYAAKATPQTVVWLTPLDKEQAKPPAPQSYTMVQRNKMFTPHILVMPVGSTVFFPNRDPFFHNVFSFFNGRRFDLGLYQSGQSRSVVFNRVGVSYIFCNIHPEMSAVILALDTPYYGTANERGEIAIPGVPAGSYTLQVWSEATSPEAMQLLTRRVTIVEGAVTDLGLISVKVAPNMLSEHLNKFGEAYDTHTPPSY